MSLSTERARQLNQGVWLIGLGLLFTTGMWWPGIMFLIGVGAIIEGLLERRGWYAFQGGFWSIAIGIWALCHYNIAVFFVAMGASMVFSAFVMPPWLEHLPTPFAKPKPKPHPIADDLVGSEQPQRAGGWYNIIFWSSLAFLLSTIITIRFPGIIVFDPSNAVRLSLGALALSTFLLWHFLNWSHHYYRETATGSHEDQRDSAPASTAQWGSDRS